MTEEIQIKGGHALSNGIKIQGPTTCVTVIREENDHISISVAEVRSETGSALLLIQSVIEAINGSVLAIVAPIALFLLLPLFIGMSIHPWIIGVLVENMIRFGLLFLAVWSITKVPDTLPSLAYHGAEHKVIHAYEENCNLTVKSVQAYPRVDDRCGTMLAPILLVTSVAATLILGDLPLIWRVFSRFAMLPVAGVASYGWFKFTVKHNAHKWIQALQAPGLALQRITVQEPTDSMIEIAITAVEKMVELEKERDLLDTGTEI